MKKEQKIKLERKMRRARRIRKKILTKSALPRLTVFRSNQYIYAQVVDDLTGKTLVSVSEREVSGLSSQAGEKMTRIQKALALGKVLAKKAGSKKIKNVVFDKGAYKYHGRIKALADGAREGGLIF